MARRLVEHAYAIVMMTISPTSGCSRDSALFCARSATTAAETAAPPMTVRSRASYGARGGGPWGGSASAATVINPPIRR